MNNDEILDTSSDFDDVNDSEANAELQEPETAENEDAPITEGAGDGEERVDFAKIADADLIALKHEFSELRFLESIAELENAERYGALRDLGLTPREAYLATAPRPRRQDNRAHLTSAVPIRAGAPDVGISSRELAAARELFSGLSDSEIRSLYRRVTK